MRGTGGEGGGGGFKRRFMGWEKGGIFAMVPRVEGLAPVRDLL